MKRHQLSSSIGLDLYDAYMDPDAPELQFLIKRATALIDDTPNTNVLEIGAGTGRFSSFLVKSFQKASTTLSALKPGGIFFLLNEFIDSYRDVDERRRVLLESVAKWVRASRDEKELTMVKRMETLIKEEKDEYFISQEELEQNLPFRVLEKHLLVENGPRDWDTILYILTRPG